MRLVIVAFDGLDHVLVKKRQNLGLLQTIDGLSDLTTYFEGGGTEGGITDEIFASFLTGLTPDEHGWKIPIIPAEKSLSGVHPTIFDLCPSTALDVPAWNRNKDHALFQARVGWWLGNEEYRQKIGMDPIPFWNRVAHQKKTLIPDMYQYIENMKLNQVRRKLEENKKLTMLYFWFTDIQGHLQKTPSNNMYKYAEWLLNYIKKIGGNERVYMVMSDHGMLHGHHRLEGYWSLSERLLDHDQRINMTDWYNIIKDWI